MHRTIRQPVFQVFTMAIVIGSVVLAIWSCENPTGQLLGNSPPQTSIANIPVNDTLAVYFRLGTLPEQTLYWSGGDPDGYVIGFRYKWTDSTLGGVGSSAGWTTLLNVTTFGDGSAVPNTILVKGTPSSLLNFYHYFQTLTNVDTIRMIGDSLVAKATISVPFGHGLPGDSVYGGDPDANISPNQGTFIFGSPDSANVHLFQVAAIDNNEAVDLTPAYVFFWTQQAPAPEARFASVARNATTGATDTLVLRATNSRWAGIRIAYFAVDPSTFEQQFSWAVDDTVTHLPDVPGSRWSPWSDDQLAIVTASNFLDLTTDTLITHRFFLRAKNRWGVISPTAETTFVAILPAIDNPNYPSKFLIINNDKIGNGTRGNPDTTTINNFYRGILQELNIPGTLDLWTTGSQRSGGTVTYRIPSRTSLTKYRAILFVYEQPPQGFVNQDIQRKFNSIKEQALRDYLNVGGKLIFSSPPNADLNIDAYLPLFEGQWSYDVFHIQGYAKNPNRDFIGARGVLGYPTIMLDTLKLPADSADGIRNIAINLPRTFAQSISAFDSRTNDPLFENQPVGIRYKALPEPPARDTYSMVLFGFPLYYGQRDAVKDALRQAIVDIGYR